MKVNRLTEKLGFFANAVRRKEDDQPTGQDRRQQQEQGKDGKDQKFDEVLEVTEKRVDEAIAQLNHDAQALSHGLTANIEGAGPGMKVILKDGTGATIRQFTGEEFLKLRQSAGATGARGKLLDRKL